MAKGKLNRLKNEASQVFLWLLLGHCLTFTGHLEIMIR